MVEYTGWGDYLQMKDRRFETEFEEWQNGDDDKDVKALEKRVDDINIEARLMRLEQNSLSDMDRINDLENVQSEKRIKDLEKFEREHKAEFHVKKGLEHIYSAKAIDELQKKVRDLEERYDKAILNRLTRLETHIEHWTERVKDLEEWKLSMLGVWTKIHELGEWKRRLDEEVSWEHADNNVKVIDKKVWEEIRDHVKLITKDHGWTSVKHLEEAIKKADPTD